MASVVVNGDTSGAVTLSAPAVAGTVTVTLPASSGTMLTTASSTGISGSAISSGTVPEAYGGTGTSTGYYGFKNRIINGAMVIDQRNTGAAVTTDNSFVVDRFQASEDTDGAFSAQRDTTVPAGFVNSLKWTTTTADGSLSAGQYSGILQVIEGFNVGDFGWGTANAQTVTLSFWVRSSLTGTFGGSFRNSANNRSYPFTYAISVANTFEYKTVTVAGDTSGTWLTDNSAGLKVFFGLGVGSTYSGTAGAWAAGNITSVTGAVSVIGTLNATWYITGVQLEKGSTATSFDYRPIGTELALCQRYFSKLSAATGNAYVALGSCVYTSAGSANGFLKYPTTMRSSPTISYGGTISFGRGISLVNITGVGTTYAGTDSALWQPNGLTGGSDKDAGVILSNNDTTAFISFSSEL